MKERLAAMAKRVEADKRRERKREEKRLKKERLAQEKQLLKESRSAAYFSCLGEAPESEEQLRSRLHSHLLTGRHKNAVLSLFAQEVLKRNKSFVNNSSADICQAEDFRVSRQSFNRAMRKVAGLLLQNIPKGILKKHIHMDAANTNLRLARQMRASKRS